MSNKAEVKVVVEYIMEIPADIMVAKVDDYIANELDEGADSNNIKKRTVTDVAFAERPGIVDRYQALYQVMDMVETLTDPESLAAGGDPKEKIESIYPIVSTVLDQVGEDEEEE
jgi:hypothetical protein